MQQLSEGRTVGLAALFAIVLVLFLPTLLSYHEVWVTAPYTHGYLIAVVTVWLTWRERDTLRLQETGMKAALMPAAALSLLWLAGTVATTRVVSQALLPAILVLWSVAAFGSGRARKLAPVAGVFLLAVPFWGIFTGVLTWATVAASGIAVRALRIPAVIEGNLIHIADGSFAIEGGCSGLNYLMAGLTVGAVYAQVLLRRWPARAAVVALAAGVSICGNWIRVASLIVIGNATSMQSSLMEAHLTYGWQIFLGGLVVFFVLAGRLGRWEARRWPVSEADQRSKPEIPIPSLATARLQPAILATLAISIGPMLFYSVGVLPTQEPQPLVLGGASPAWQPSAALGERPFGWQPDAQGAVERRYDIWTNGAEPVVVDRLVFRDQTQETELIGSTSRIAQDSVLVVERLFGYVGAERRLLREAVVRDRTEHLLVWYWYRVGGVETSSSARAKLLQVWAFFRRIDAAELITVSARCDAASCSGASRLLSSFMGSPDL